jgi:ubiquinone/menaquinone biosynthesis C-methylase UbiE
VSIPDGSFDLVTSGMVFEPHDNPVEVLREGRRVLNDRGMLVVHTASAMHYVLSVGRVLTRLLSRSTSSHLVSLCTGRAEKDIFPSRYATNTVAKFSKAALSAGLVEAGFVAHFDTPHRPG